jgi:hypothetical protein
MDSGKHRQLGNLMKIHLVVMAVVLCGCGSDEIMTVGSGPPSASPPAPIKNLSVFVNILGDRSTAPASLPLYVDQAPWGQVELGQETRFTVTSGLHTIEVLADTTAHWCIPKGGTSVQQNFTRTDVAAVSFALDCPSLLGTGTVNVAVTITGFVASIAGLRTVPAELTRINGPPSGVAVTLRSGTPQSLTLEAGLYKLVLQERTYCHGPSEPPLVAVRAGTAAALVTATYSCI